MKKSEIITALEKGEVLAFGEYLLSRPETIKYMDKTTHQPATFDKLSHTVLTPHGARTVEEDTRSIPDFKPATYQNPFKKGQAVVIAVNGLAIIKGVTTLKGRLIPLTD